MSNQSSLFRPERRIAWQKGVQPPGTTGVPNQSSSFPKRSGIETIREVDGSPSIDDATILEVSDGTLSEPSPGVARVTTGGGTAGIRVREKDGSPLIDPTTILTVPNDSLTNPAAGEAELDYARGDQAFEVLEVVLIFSSVVGSGTAFNIQTGVYSGAGSPATVKGDTTVTLPASAAAFNDEGRIEVTLNGQELDKGGTGSGSVTWISTTQISLPGNRVFPGNRLRVRAPA